jgi:hypothetical protein
MNGDSSLSLSGLRRKIAAVLALSLGIRVLTVWALVLGTSTLIARAALGVTGGRLLVVAGLILAPAFLVVAILAVRRVPPTDRLLAFLDARQHLGGLLVASGEVELGDWQSQVVSSARVSVRWQARSWSVVLACSWLYLAVALVVPVSSPWTGDRSRGLDVDQEVEQLTTAVEVLEEVRFVEPEQADLMLATLAEIAAEAVAEEPAKTFETLDRTGHEVEQTAAAGVEELLAQEQRLTEAEAAAEALRQQSSKLTEQQRRELGEELARLGATLDLGAERELSQVLKQGLETATLSPEMLAELEKALERARQDLTTRMVKLEQVRLVDVKAVKQCRRCGKSSSEQLLAYLAESREEADTAALIAAACRAPGRGGVNRGRGDADMTWRDGAEPAGATFEERELPPASLAALREAQLTGISAAAPDQNEPSNTASATALTGGGESGGSAVQRQLLPRHRKAVEKYFERDSGATRGGAHDRS